MAGIAHIFVSGIIGDDFFSFAGDEMGTTLADVRRQYNSFTNPDSATIRINSIGGDFDEGLAIHDEIRSWGIPITTVGEGKVYSIATTVLLAGDKGKRFVREHTRVLVHNPTPARIPEDFKGEAKDFEQMAERLRARESELANFYASKTNIQAESIRGFMDNETTWVGQDAVSAGFADAVEAEPIKAVAFIRPQKTINNEQMAEVTQNQELEKARGLFAEIKAFFAKNEAAAAPAPVEVVEEPTETKENEELLKMQEEIAALKAQLAEVEAGKAEAEAAATEQAAQHAKIMAQVMEKVEALEKMPIIAAGKDITQEVVTPQGKPEPHKMDAVAEYFKHQMARM